MKLSILVAALAIAALSCKPDPAKSVKIVGAAPTAGPVAPTLPPWKDGNCKLAPAEPGGSTFAATGPCAFQHSGVAKCHAVTDDGYAQVLRNTTDGGTVGLYINVETYSGAKSYQNAQVILTYQKGSSYYHWSSDSVAITVSPGFKSLVLPSNNLRAEPPNTGTEVVSGTLLCAPSGDSSLTTPRG